MEKEIPLKFNSLVNPQAETVEEPALAKRETMDEGSKKENKEKNILDRVKPRPNKKTKETTENQKPKEGEEKEEEGQERKNVASFKSIQTKSIFQYGSYSYFLYV